MLKLYCCRAVWLVLLIVGYVRCAAPLDSTLVFSKGEGDYYCQKIPYLLTTAAGALIAFAEGRGRYNGTSCDDFKGTDLVYKRSEDGGKTWSALTVLYTNSSETESNVIGNAAPVVDSSSGIIWLPFCRNNEEVYITRSIDDGKTWETPVHQPHLVLDDWKWVGLGPPAGLQLSSGRLLIPSYHTVHFKGDGCDSVGHTVVSDDHGATWRLGAETFGEPYLSNECQAVELYNGTVLINSRVVSTHRIQIVSHDGGLTFDAPTVVPSLQQTIEGCEGSILSDPNTNILYFSIPNNDLVIRRNMTVFQSFDEGSTWSVLSNVDRGAVSYSALQIYPASGTAAIARDVSKLGLLYERSNEMNIIFDPDEIIFCSFPLTNSAK